MSTLDDKILKQNVPGQWSSQDDRSDIRGEDSLAHEEEDETFDATGETERGQETVVETERLLNHTLIPDSIKSGIMGERSRKTGTGVKGVLADYKVEQALKAAERDAVKAEREAALHRIAYGAQRPAGDPSAPPMPMPMGMLQAGDDSDLEDEEDALFMEQFRAARLRELQGQAQAVPQPQYKTVDTVDSSEELLEEVGSCDPRTTVVVHMFEPSISACQLLNRFMEELAVKWPDVRFLRIQASNTNLMIDRVALPAVSIYRAGDIVTVLAGLVEELGDRFGRDDVEWLLESAEGWAR
jgi:hypothetical protein